MKRVILSPVFLFVLGMILVINCKANNVPKETYVPQVIIEAPWGNETGQFGVYFPPEGGPGVGPFTFTISPQGEIYIFDPVNSRIQKFDSGGRFLLAITLSKGGMDICVNNSGNIYLYDGGLVPKRIYQYDSEGNFTKEYPIVWKDGSMGWGPIYCDKSGRLFLSYRSDSLKTKMVFQVGTTETIFTLEQQKSTLQTGSYLGLNANLPDWEKYLSKIQGKTYSINSKINTQKIIAKELNLSREGLLGIDEEAVYNIAKDEKSTDVSVILKYNYDGDLLTTYTLNWKEGKCEAFQTEEEVGIWVSKEVIFDKGNLYTYIRCKDGLKIIKWSPVEGGK
jgi:hypothetical protein